MVAKTKRKGRIDMLISTLASFFVPAVYIKDLSENLMILLKKQNLILIGIECLTSNLKKKSI